jgi:hypothetical protein
MEWESNLSGVKELFRPPPPIGQEQGVPADEIVKSGGLVLQIPTAASSAATKAAQIPPPPAVTGPPPPPPKDIEIVASAGDISSDSSISSASASVSASASATTPASATASSGGEREKQRPMEKKGPENLQVRVETFLQRAKERNVAEIKERMGKDYNIYAAIAANNRRASYAPNLLGGPAAAPHSLPGMVDQADGRIMSGGLQLDMSNKEIICTSFDADWACLRCGEHGQAPAFKIRGIPDASCSRQVVILADQSFPACLPAMGEQECLRILLVENGSVLDLVETFLRKLGNRRVPAGSVILLFSASFLQQAGLELYTAELVQAEARIHAVIGKETIFQPLPPILLGGTEDSNLVRAMMELVTWSDTYFAGNDYLEKSSGLAIKVISESGTGSRADIEARRYALPLKVKIQSGSGQVREPPGPCPVH